ncbi:MAG TPA: hypothetical protein ENH23_03930, partial [candidate division Zixibacteria bacterium]|nr:hypothetical protein [candidate division Zixibacteria bacterium]
MFFFVSSLTDASENARIVSSANSSLTIQVQIIQTNLHTYISEKNEVSYYQSLVLAVPYNGDITLAGLHLGTLKAFSQTQQFPLAGGRDKIIEFSDPLFVRGEKLITVYIFPVTPSGVYDEVEFTVQFSGTTSNGKAVSVDSPFEKMLSASVLNYEQSKQFAQVPIQSLASGAESGPFAENSEWIKIEINKNGLYKLTGAQLDASGLSVTGEASASIHLYNGGGVQLPVLNEIERPLFEEVAIKVIDGGDGIFDSNDYILFYGESVNRWVYETAQTVFKTHSYTERNVYWLDVSSLTSGLRIQSSDASINGVVNGSVSQTLDQYTRRVHIEQNNILRRWSDNRISDYYTWYWTNDNNLSFFVSTEHILTDDTVRVILDGITGDTTGSSDENEAINFYVNG